MSKKKEQVKILKKSFGSVVKAFGKEKNKKNRNEAFEFLTGRIAEFRHFRSEIAGKAKADQAAEPVAGTQAAGGVQPSPALVDELRASHHATQN